MKIMLQLIGEIDGQKLYDLTTKLEGKPDNLQSLIYGMALVGIDPQDFQIALVGVNSNEEDD